MNEKEIALRKRMCTHIKGCNKALTEEYLDMQDTEILLCFCHPTDRRTYEMNLKNCYPKIEN